MKNFVAQFDTALVRQINEHVRLAGRIWREAKPDLSQIRITAGNYAAYGSYRALCRKSGMIEIPIGNSFGLLEFGPDNTIVNATTDAGLLGIVLHEIGHHVINTATVQPWQGCKSIDDSKHLCASWLWICATGWNHFHHLELTGNQIVDAARADHDKWVKALTHFNPYVKPPAARARSCAHCGADISSHRASAKFCGAKCRVYASRVKETA